MGEGNVGDFIRQRRTNLGMTVAEACRRAAITHPVWLRVESGETTEPRWSTIIAMLKALDTVVEVNIKPGEHQWMASPGA